MTSIWCINEINRTYPLTKTRPIWSLCETQNIVLADRSIVSYPRGLKQAIRVLFSCGDEGGCGKRWTVSRSQADLRLQEKNDLRRCFPANKGKSPKTHQYIAKIFHKNNIYIVHILVVTHIYIHIWNKINWSPVAKWSDWRSLQNLLLLYYLFLIRGRQRANQTHLWHLINETIIVHELTTFWQGTQIKCTP